MRKPSSGTILNTSFVLFVSFVYRKNASGIHQNLEEKVGVRKINTKKPKSSA